MISDWIVRTMDLPITNILFCGGGRFDILLPNSKEMDNEIKKIKNVLDGYLLKEFYGELSTQITTKGVTTKDFFDFDKVYKDAEDKLIESKARKFDGMITWPYFFKSTGNVEDVCRSCLMLPVQKGGECEQCKTQREMIGSHLPRTDFIVFVYGEYEGPNGVRIPFEKFGVTILLKSMEEMELLLKEEKKTKICIYRLNPEFKEGGGLDFLKRTSEKNPISFGFKFFGNSAPLAMKECQILPAPKEPAKEGEVLDFEEIAKLSTGANYLGVLKMDVDYLGLLFSLGIEPPSISRVATLSSNLEIFFNAWLNNICKTVTKKWEDSLSKDDQKKGLVESLFYTVYSGGDDLFIIGPWDQIIELAWEIHKDFGKYTCQNPNISLSGGIIFVKPQFPIHRFAHLVTEELDKSKRDADKPDGEGLKEKNRVTFLAKL